MTDKISNLRRVATAIVIAGVLLVLAAAVQVLHWSFDYMPPFALKAYTVTPAQAGEMATVEGAVRRDLERECSAVYNRFFVDARGARYELLEAPQLMNAVSIRAYDELYPGKLTFKFRIPPKAAPGTATVLTVLNYVCNPVHKLHPIELVTAMKVEVLP